MMRRFPSRVQARRRSWAFTGRPAPLASEINKCINVEAVSDRFTRSETASTVQLILDVALS